MGFIASGWIGVSLRIYLQAEQIAVVAVQRLSRAHEKYVPNIPRGA
jgi:hypothetical protein